MGRAVVMSVAAVVPAAVNPVVEAIAVDPSQLAASMCGGRGSGMGVRDALLAASAVAASPGSAGTVPLYPDLAAAGFAVSSSDAAAQRWFSQGLMLTYGFNHAGAVASFRKAQQADPRCAMCWWGEAVALGPNINAPMDDRDRGAALAALARAVALKDAASPRERALIEALATRYAKDPAADRVALDAAYAGAMLKVAAAFPGDDDIAVLAAEAVMDTSPWNYWEADRKTPLGLTGEAVRLLEAVLARNPDHVQAAHLYIHMMEASDPTRAGAAADRLARAMVPNAAHLVHMPGHIWVQQGRYRETMAANRAAARADEAFIAATGDRGLVRYGYYPHNLHFIVTAAQMAGDMDAAVTEAQRLRTLMDVDTSARIGWVQAIDAAPFLAMAQFADAAAILAMPAADARLPYANAMRHYARAVARAQQRDAGGFAQELAALAAMREAAGVKELVAQGIPVPDLITLAERAARGRWAMAMGRYAEAAGHFRQAGAVEAGLAYMEPRFWYYPVAQSLGAALYLGGDLEGARTAFQAALAQAPANGWAFYGLAMTEAAAGHEAEAQAARAALGRAWAGEMGWLRMGRL
jgi:tetratricopeptide (TPR) repeat protein